MIALLAYIHTCFIRSYRYGPPVILYILGIIWIYSVGPNPVMDSYAFSASFLFVIAAVLSYTNIDLESPNQESVTVVHSGSLSTLILAKIVYSWLFTLPLAIFAVLYPALIQSFERAASPGELGMSFFSHAALSWLGVSLACWFSAKLIRSRLLSFLLLSISIVISFGMRAIENSLPERIDNLVWLFPPLIRTITVLSDFAAASLLSKMLAIGAPLLYGGVLLALFLIVMKKRKLDYP